MSQNSLRPLRYRQIHLDFHTSEHIPGIGSQFDAEAFVDTLKQSHVNSITLFAKCHHGWSYYPTKVGAPHPNLSRPDLLGEMIAACNAADIETPIYLSVQWDERTARLHPEWRVMKANNHLDHADDHDRSAQNQLSAAWHTLCLNQDDFRSYLMAEAREVLTLYPTAGLFFDIIQTPDCVCTACLARMARLNLDPLNKVDRLANDEAVNAQFREEMSTVLRREFPQARIFYNSGHINKYGKDRFAPYTHLELESLPTGGWGYNHFPSSARYAARLGLDFVSHTGKFHTSWGEFGGFKHPDALEYECAMMVALGSKCLVGDQLHPNGRINADTYRSIAPAFRRIAALEPFLEGAEQVSDIAILATEYFHRDGVERVRDSDDGAVQMLLELHRCFDVIDPEMDFSRHRLIILPDTIPVDAALKAKFDAYLASGGAVLISGQSGRTPNTGAFAFETGLTLTGENIAFEPSYAQITEALTDARLPASPFVVYAEAEKLQAAGATVLASIRPPYFNRAFNHFCSHQHTPDDPEADAIGVACAVHGKVGTIAYPVFALYRAMGQPLYKYLVDALIERLMPGRMLETTLPSAGRATLTVQAHENRSIVHLLCGIPQIRGQSVRINWQPTARPMEMIEDIPSIGPLSFTVRLPGTPSSVYDAISGETFAWKKQADGAITVDLPGLSIHRAIVIDGVVPK
ncbi:hypothetical protein RvVAR0630_40490 [Agrobacterium vitis]|uniref:alpha-L-fucosidase n=1 Tax=Agrobacterium vitis TaxID=373 RepID=UPI0015D8A8DB|nr:alpha-L-fucosidase [Agrobacterium vitis]BCH61425.1 hypothetical protein RvVAR0630_40490 [Agrobacterium vitis]